MSHHRACATGRAGRRAAQQGGATAAELVVILPILLALVLGMFSGGIAYDRKLTLVHAAREAARFGATLPFDSDWLDAVADRAEEAAVGNLAANESGRYICVAYVSSDGSAQRLERFQDGSTATATGDCRDVDDSSISWQARVQVRVERTADFNAFFFSRTITVGSSAVARHERST